MHRSLTEGLLLVLSNLLLLPALFLTIRRYYYVDTAVILMMFLASSFYHACDAGWFCITDILDHRMQDHFMCTSLFSWLVLSFLGIPLDQTCSVFFLIVSSYVLFAQTCVDSSFFFVTLGFFFLFLILVRLIFFRHFRSVWPTSMTSSTMESTTRCGTFCPCRRSTLSSRPETVCPSTSTSSSIGSRSATSSRAFGGAPRNALMPPQAALLNRRNPNMSMFDGIGHSQVSVLSRSTPEAEGGSGKKGESGAWYDSWLFKPLLYFPFLDSTTSKKSSKKRRKKKKDSMDRAQTHHHHQVSNNEDENDDDRLMTVAVDGVHSTTNGIDGNIAAVSSLVQAPVDYSIKASPLQQESSIRAHSQRPI